MSKRKRKGKGDIADWLGMPPNRDRDTGFNMWLWWLWPLLALVVWCLIHYGFTINGTHYQFTINETTGVTVEARDTP
jgi:hypothetical protein